MSARNTPTSYVRRSTVLFAAAAFTLGLVIPYRLALGHPQQQRPQGFPDLVGGLKAVPGCLGVETARTASGKNVIFAWFEDKKAVLNWYYSDTHQHAMRMLVGDQKPDPPLQGVPDDIGPILVIASVTMSDKPKFEGVSMPLSQISIEVYKPVTGGIFLRSRSAPAGLKAWLINELKPQPSKEG